MGLAVAVGAATAITATTVLESVAVVGAVVGAVGAVTKNKTLSMIGLGLGLVGGVGALATSALGVGSAAITGGAEAGAGAAAGGVDVASGGVAGMDAAEAAANPAADIAASAASGAAPDIFGDLSGAVSSDVPTTMDAAEAASAPSGLLNGGLGAAPTGGDLNLLTTTSESANPADVIAPGTTGTSTSTATNPTIAANPTLNPDGSSMLPGATSPNNPADLLNPDGSAVVPPTPPEDGAPGMFSNVIGFVEKHPTLAFGALQAGGSLLSGMTNPLTPAQVSALNAQSAANNAAAALATQQAANLNMPKSVAQSAPVTGTPPLVPGQQGLINRASQPVTGVAA